jgi:SnoaL-like polyketide cyclase
MDAGENLRNMKKLDDSWNAQDLETFRRYHSKDCIVRWPNQPPTHGREGHEQEAIAFFKKFPDQHLVNPYKIMLGQGEWTCTVADFTGTMKGPMIMPDGTVVPPTNKSFHMDFCTVARWNEEGEIVEENLFYDLMGMLKQIGGLSGEQRQKVA